MLRPAAIFVGLLSGAALLVSPLTAASLGVAPGDSPLSCSLCFHGQNAPQPKSCCHLNQGPDRSTSDEPCQEGSDCCPCGVTSPSPVTAVVTPRPDVILVRPSGWIGLGNDKLTSIREEPLLPPPIA